MPRCKKTQAARQGWISYAGARLSGDNGSLVLEVTTLAAGVVAIQVPPALAPAPRGLVRRVPLSLVGDCEIAVCDEDEEVSRVIGIGTLLNWGC